MKLHLPKQLFTALLAAIACLPQIKAEGTIYTITAQSGTEMANATYTETIKNEDGTYTLTTTTQSGWGSGSGPAADVVSGNNIIRFADGTGVNVSNKALTYTFDNWEVGGLVVDASGYSITAGIGKRPFDMNAGSYDINYSFSINTGNSNNQDLNFSGVQAWDVASDAEMSFISHANKAIVVGGDYDSANATANVTFSGAGEVAFNSLLQINSGSELSLNTTATANNNISNYGTLIVNSGATFTTQGAFTNYGTLVLGSTMQGTGTVTNSGNGVIKLGDYSLNNFTNVTYVGGGTSGFVNTLTVFANPSAYSGSVYVGDTAYDVTDGGISLGGSDTTYYVNEDLSYNADTMGGATVIAITQNSTLTAPTESVSGHSLVGNGVYKLAAGTTAFTSGMTFGEEWTGTVLLGNTSSNDFDFDNFGTASSIVEIGENCTISTYLANANVEYDTNIKLTGDLEITNGWSTKTYTFAGKILGAGSITKSNQHSTVYKFLNDVRDWEGSLVCTNGTLTTMFAGKASVINAGIKANNGTINLEVSTESAAQFNKAVTVNTIILNQSTSFDNALTVSTTANVSAGKTLTLGGGTAESPITHTIGTLSAAGGTVSIAENSSLNLGAATHSIGTLSAANSTITMAQGGMLTLGSDNTATESTIGTVVASTAGNTINLNDKATLNTITKESSSGTITLTGSGIYRLRAGSLTSNVSGLTDDTWTGTVEISGGTGSTGWGTFSGVYNSGSKVALNGVAGHLSHTADITANLILMNGTAIDVQNGSSNATTTLIGSVEGDGDFKFTGWNSRNNQLTYKFKGDLSEWSGRFVNASSVNHDVNVYFLQDGTEENPAVIFKNDSDDTLIGVTDSNASSSSVNVVVGTSENATAVVKFNGIIDNTNVLTVNNQATFTRDVSVRKLAGNGSLTFAPSDRETLNPVLNVSAGDKNYAIASTTVETGAKLVFASDNDMIDFTAPNLSITLNGGTWELGTGRQTLGSNFQLILNSGTMSGTNLKEGSTQNSNHDGLGALDFYADGGKISSTGESTITGGIRLRKSIDIDVQDGELIVDAILQGNRTNSGITKKGDGTLTITMGETVYMESLYTGTTEIQAGKVSFTSTGERTLSTVKAAAAANLTLSGNTSITTLDGDGSITLNDDATLTLSGGTAEAQKEHCIGTVTSGEGGGVSLEDYATLTLSNIPGAIAESYSNGNNDTTSSLQLAINGGNGSVLNLVLDDVSILNSDDGWKRNSTVTLTQREDSGLKVRVSSGYLANCVFGVTDVNDYGSYATTNLGGSGLIMANGTSLVLRKSNATENFGAGDISL